MRIIILSILCLYTISYAESKKNPLPYFRHKVEEITDDTPVEKVTDDSQSNLLSLLVKNVKELFNEFDGDVKSDSDFHGESTITVEPIESSSTKIEAETETETEGEHMKTQEVVTRTTEIETETETEKEKGLEKEMEKEKQKEKENDKEKEIETETETEKETETIVNIMTGEPEEKELGSGDSTSNEFNTVAPEVLTSTTEPNSRNKNWENLDNTNDIMLYENISLINTMHHLDEPTATEAIEVVESTKFVETEASYYKTKKEPKELKSIEKYKGSYNNEVIKGVTPLTSISSYVLESRNFISRNEPNKTCVYCNNLITDNCKDPKNKIVPSIVCKRASDLCYSLHTPFGLVDRGCFNINHNLTTYVCSCNLCNYISISEMPYFFGHKKDWVENVFELSHTRNFRQSVFKDMSCLRCEVNQTVKARAMVDSVNCLEGNIGNLPIEECNPNEICGVRAKRSDGYIWRGCVRRPLYNYWISLCGHDLCNFDKLISIYNH